MIVRGLGENNLVLASFSMVPCEAFAQSRLVIAQATAGAVAALLVAVSHHKVGAGRALLEGAVRAAVACVAHAPGRLLCVPWGRVRFARLLGEHLLSVADTVLVTIVRAHGPLARYPVIVVEALAGAQLAVAESFVRALDHRMGLVGGGRHGNPCGALGAGAQGAIGSRPGRFAVRPCEAIALGIPVTVAVARAKIRAAAAESLRALDLRV
mmetsp:Transcript_34944/g.93488  ORF Transcript_34944/g.93488 Transcript_34944/m.93488 type:complete len:211 (+) Transcript_34944:118-750(+)|eukprot:CAMPEP_0119533204 /NCGR_PEP_ID=MMETSP1344-20130328/46622_1 /TAXON_ID=236787 /ORGANISM="Florenciella parvula, Strain CCMP2471" /LENGTH=210 /DNA_ID=CAMNT_0007573995 /DNA_START=372 /DNA_END=1004 /DNA_ORIENTATION=-